MMNKVKIMIVAAAFAVTLSTPQLAIANIIVVLKAKKAMFASEKAIALGQNLSAQLKPQTIRLDAMGQELQALQQRLEADKDIMSNDEVQKLQAEIQAVSVEYQKLKQYLSNVKLQVEQEFLANMRPVLDKVLRQLVEENDISLIINGQSAIYNAAGIDITSKVVELLNLEP
ncbi:MAG: outer membrane protein [Oceanospirillaceae bacterium]|jgi:outer membrane protein|tara:strand:+ start:65 stop:580 length:516 start_codon:yes stop_codon:yes gene_type:complete